MKNTPYHKCIFTIKHSKTLSDFYNNNGKRGEIVEYRPWSTAQDLLIKIDGEQPFLVLFAAAERVGDLLYYAVIDEIKIIKQLNPKTAKPGYETTFKFSDMVEFSVPRPHKTDLNVISVEEDMSRGQIRGYTICRTLPVLLHDAELLTPGNARIETRIILRELTSRNMQGTDSIFSDDVFKQHGESMKQARRERRSKEINELFKKKHDLAINANQVQNCETFADLVALVIQTLELQQTG